MPLPDEAFSSEIGHKISLPGATDIGLWVNHYATSTRGEWINIEFGSTNRDRALVDWYADPEDLERLGILFQYLGQTAREKRDGS